MAEKKIKPKRPVKRVSRKLIKKAHKINKPVKKTRSQPKKMKLKPTKPQKTNAPIEKKKLIGTVSHYFTDIGVCVIELTGALKTGDTILIEGATTNFRQTVRSMQINRKPVTEAGKGDVIGLKVGSRVRQKDSVYLL